MIVCQCGTQHEPRFNELEEGKPFFCRNFQCRAVVSRSRNYPGFEGKDVTVSWGGWNKLERVVHEH